MRSLSRIECFTVGCNNEASTTINSEHVCTQCAKAALPTKYHKFLSPAKVIHSREDICLWPCGTWCYREELSGMTHMSDDYETLYVGSEAYEKFCVANYIN